MGDKLLLKLNIYGKPTLNLQKVEYSDQNEFSKYAYEFRMEKANPKTHTPLSLFTVKKSRLPEPGTKPKKGELDGKFWVPYKIVTKEDLKNAINNLKTLGKVEDGPLKGISKDELVLLEDLNDIEKDLIDDSKEDNQTNLKSEEEKINTDDEHVLVSPYWSGKHSRVGGRNVATILIWKEDTNNSLIVTLSSESDCNQPGIKTRHSEKVVVDAVKTYLEKFDFKIKWIYTEREPCNTSVNCQKFLAGILEKYGEKKLDTEIYYSLDYPNDSKERKISTDVLTKKDKEFVKQYKTIPK